MRLRRRVRKFWQRHADRCLLGGAAAAIAATLLGPGVVLERNRFEHVVVLDVTQSMNVQDQVLDNQPVSRLAFARDALRATLLALPCGSKIGWGVFTEYRAYLLIAPVEVCGHMSELRDTLARIDNQMAWSGNSEIAKGLHSTVGIVKQLAGRPSLVFVTDGHESPPLNPRHRPAFDDKPGDVSGLIVGVGALQPSPIPKTDAQGLPLGFWRAAEVMQADPYSQGRSGSVSGEQLIEDAAGAGESRPLGATPGTEHLSSLHEPYLRLLASEQGLTFHRLESRAAFAAALMGQAMARPMPVRTDLRPAFALLALGLLLTRHRARLFARFTRTPRSHGRGAT